MIESVYKQGDDALVNMAELQFPVFNLFGLADPLKFRTTQISIPEYMVGAYEVHWKTQRFEKPSGKDDSPKTMTFTFRVDKYYTVYKALMAWWQLSATPIPERWLKTLGRLPAHRIFGATSRSDAWTATISPQPKAGSLSGAGSKVCRVLILIRHPAILFTAK
jgi:hypothetical protein